MKNADGRSPSGRGRAATTRDEPRRTPPLSLIEATASAIAAGGRFADAGALISERLGIDGPLPRPMPPEARKLAQKAIEYFEQGKDLRRAATVLLALREPERAAELLDRAGENARAGRIRARIARGEYREPPGLRSPGAARNLPRDPITLEEAGLLEAALWLHTERERYADAARLARQLGRHEQAAELAVAAGLPFEAATSFFAAGVPDRAFEHFLQVPRTDARYRRACVEAIRAADELDAVSPAFDGFLRRFLATGPEDEGEREALRVLGRLYQAHDYPDNAREVFRLVAGPAAAEAPAPVVTTLPPVTALPPRVAAPVALAADAADAAEQFVREAEGDAGRDPGGDPRRDASGASFYRLARRSKSPPPVPPPAIERPPSVAPPGMRFERPRIATPPTPLPLDRGRVPTPIPMVIERPRIATPTPPPFAAIHRDTDARFDEPLDRGPPPANPPGARVVVRRDTAVTPWPPPDLPVEPMPVDARGPELHASRPEAYDGYDGYDDPGDSRDQTLHDGQPVVTPPPHRAIAPTPRRPEPAVAGQGQPSFVEVDWSELAPPLPAPGPDTSPHAMHEAAAPPAATEAPLVSTSEPGTFDVGALIAGRYRIEEQIGRGGMAIVYRALDLELAEFIALKLFHSRGDSDSLLQRFRQELRLARQLTHNNIIRLYDIGIHETRHYISMELLKGQNLYEKMGSPRVREVSAPLPLDVGLDYLIQTCAGLQAAHDQQVVHRDVKPENIFITDEGTVKLMDFGIAKKRFTPGPTMQGLSAGTPEYMAPEQIKHFSEVTAACDLYSLGVSAYQMFTGHLPFEHDDLVTLLMMHATAPPELPQKWNPKMPPALQSIILKLLAKRPEQRFPSCRALAEKLEALHREVLGVAHPSRS